MKLNDAAFLIEKKGSISINSPELAGLLKATLDKGFPFRFQAKGFSMTPFIKDGDVVTIYPLVDKYIGVGDVVAFVDNDNERFGVHRVISIKKNNFFIKGDRLFKADGLVLRENILGRVEKVERDNKNITFGLGPEKAVIAFFSRAKFFNPIFFIWSKMPDCAKIFVRRSLRYEK